MYIIDDFFVDDTYQSMLKYITTKFPDSTGIVYCMTKSDCEETADFLRANKVSYCYANLFKTCLRLGCLSLNF